MRIKKLHLAGLVVALAGGVTGKAAAEDLQITTDTNTPVSTSDPVAGGLVDPGSIEITTTGSILITAGQTGITADAVGETVENNGSIDANNANNVTAIRLANGGSGNIEQAGSILLVEDHTQEDDDDDGDLDGAVALGTNRHAILLDAGAYTGDVLHSGNITVEGNDSAGIRFNGQLVGDLTITAGSMTVLGDNSQGVYIGDGVTGDVLLRGPVFVRGEGSTGLVVEGEIGGELRLSNSWSTSGYHSISRPADTSDLDAGDLSQGGGTVAIHDNVVGGVTIEGRGVEDDPDDDGDGDTEAEGDTNDDASADLRNFGSAPTVWVAADTANVALGTAGNYGLVNRGTIAGAGIFDDRDATGLRIEGIGFSVTTGDGIVNDGSITASAVDLRETAPDGDVEAFGVVIGAGADVPTLLNRGQVISSVISDTDQFAYGIVIGAGADVDLIHNMGIIRAEISGEGGGATAITDVSGSVDEIRNSGVIAALATPTDDDFTDGVVPPALGSTVAIDFTLSGANVVLNQIAIEEFTDDDAVDDDEESRPDPLIQGDILFGAGANTVNLHAGMIAGDISFGDGADELEIDNGATFQGVLSDSDDILALDIIDGTLDLRGGSVTVTTADFGDDAELVVLLSENPLESTHITATSAVTFAAGAVVRPVLPSGLPEGDTIEFLDATFGLSIADRDALLGEVAGEGVPYLYNVEVLLDNPAALDGAPNALLAAYDLKTAAELGLTSNQSAALDAILDALRTDDAASDAILELDDQGTFLDAYEDLVPSYASAAAELATTAIQQSQSATSNRLAATRLHDLDEVSLWAQEIGYALSREPPTLNGQAYDGHGFGFALGIDGPLESGGLFGLSASFIASEVEEDGRPDGEIAASFGQVNAYYGTALGPVDLDFIVGAGIGQLQSQRMVEIGDNFSAETEAEWSTYEGHGSIRAAVPMTMGNWLVITPQTALTYVYMSEEGYEEEGGGDAIDYEADSVTSQRLWGDVGVEFAGRMRMMGQTVVAPRLFVGYRANLIDEEAERTFRFVSGGDEFTLIDEGLGDGAPIVGIGVDASNGYSTFTLGYEGEFGDQIERHSLNASVRFRF